MLKNFLLIWLDGDEARVDEIISENDWVEMTASRLGEVLEKYAAQPPRAGDEATCPRCRGILNNDGYCLACGHPFPPRA